MSVFTLISCNDLVEKPYTFYSKENIFSDEAGASMALTGVYGLIQKVYPNTISVGYAPTDELVQIGWAQNSDNIANLSFGSEHGKIRDYWKNTYRAMNACNTFLVQMEKANYGTPTSKVMIGEAKFIRGLLYFNLVRLFGEVPLLTEGTDGATDMRPKKASVKKIYEQVVRDLEDAKGLLLPADEIEQQPRFSRGSAQGLLAMVYATMAGYPLQQKDRWKDVVAVCEEMEKEGVHKLNPSFTKVFADATEDIYDTEYNEILIQIAFTIGKEGSLNSATGIGAGDRGVYKEGGSWASLFPVKRFLKTYDMEDIRFKWSFPLRRDAKEFGYDKLLTTKYKRRSSNDYHPFANPLNWYVMRYSDLILLYAEAINEVNQKPTQKACDLINEIRLRARPEDKKDDNSIVPFVKLEEENYDSFVEEVRSERAKELALEGVRWYDLKRWGILITTIKNIALGDDGLSWSQASSRVRDKHILYPIPQTELNKNENLYPQNTGY